MIKGRTQSADGGFRRIPVRRTQIVNEKTRLSIIDYLDKMIFQKCQFSEWVGSRDLFSRIPEDIVNTPLNVVYTLCCEKFSDDSHSIFINFSKYLGILTREAVYSSEKAYYEVMEGSIRKYKLVSKK